ncbi:hypothetical protein V5F49_20210 [Xanthobacter sp. V3C-3]|uniref:hypothetical protein n=1 Tax=Xanthobacter lutulentifluminis TaxID=3119935 RepID=UPI0037291C36
MPGSDDLVARLHNAERHEFQATALQRVPVHRSDARKLFIEAASALASRDKEIERLRDLFRVDGEQHAAHVKGLTERHEARITKYADAVAEQRALAATATRDRDEAIREMSEWAKKAGEAEGRLKASEWPDVVEGWRERAETAERERDEARAEVERLRNALEPFARADRAIGNEPGPFRFETGTGYRLIERHDLRQASAALHHEGGEHG